MSHSSSKTVGNTRDFISHQRTMDMSQGAIGKRGNKKSQKSTNSDSKVVKTQKLRRSLTGLQKKEL